ncbi:23S rRNA (adenine(2030)-N(6))-methyltransferase RlmJ [Cognatilysobacter lacus]|uniref:Ribosomal RNA large subunit methyltransferase J n=1 Tax=Cognatilysobacter lacus TaxID=1643323 RepID=A0A5D8Z9Z9_9GAMM|nr:23S rRNA (adenine(2030)-N(6))-methyltransferase RlmJ [Lysobacter lacus]TZF91728.1 23S rRNA (adenine(2030)-N(6))-methyltransferase RlmJ [Lysobacter lacus]
MNYRHAFHAGNHADVLKHTVLLMLCEVLADKPAPLFALDTHAGRGIYRLDDAKAQRTGEATGGVGRVPDSDVPIPLRPYAAAVAACRAAHGPSAYPGSPWLLAHALRAQDRIACCELQHDEADALRANFAGDPRVAAHARDGYTAMHALLPPRIGTERFGRGLVLIDPPFESQMEEFDVAITALRDALQRFPQATYALWYPIKLRRTLHPVFRRLAALPAKSVLVAEVLVRPDDSPLRMNGSGLVLFNAPWKFDARLRTLLPALARVLGDEGRGTWRVDWLKAPE